MQDKDNTNNVKSQGELQQVLDDLLKRKETILKSKNEDEINGFIEQTLSYIKQLDEADIKLRNELANYDQTKKALNDKIKRLEAQQETLKQEADEIRKRDIENNELLKAINNRTIETFKGVKAIYDLEVTIDKRLKAIEETQKQTLYMIYGLAFLVLLLLALYVWR